MRSWQVNDIVPLFFQDIIDGGLQEGGAPAVEEPSVQGEFLKCLEDQRFGIVSGAQ